MFAAPRAGVSGPMLAAERRGSEAELPEPANAGRRIGLGRPDARDSSIRLPQGSSTKNRVDPGISSVSAQRTALPLRPTSPASRSSAPPRARGSRMRLRRRGELLRDSDVQLVRPDAEPDAAAPREERWLRDLLEAEKTAVEPSRVVLAPGRCRDLDMVERDHGAAHRERLDVPRDPGPEKRTRFSRWVPCRTPVKPSSGPGLPSCCRWFTLRARGHAQRRAGSSLLAVRARGSSSGRVAPVDLLGAFEPDERRERGRQLELPPRRRELVVDHLGEHGLAAVADEDFAPHGSTGCVTPSERAVSTSPHVVRSASTPGARGAASASYQPPPAATAPVRVATGFASRRSTTAIATSPASIATAASDSSRWTIRALSPAPPGPRR